MRVYVEYPKYCCPYCGKPVGYLGRAIAWLVGTSWHDCDNSNIRFGEPPNADN